MHQFPKVETILRTAAEDITTFADFPCAALEEDLADQSVGAVQQGDQTVHGQVRRCSSWHRWSTLSMPAHAFRAVGRTIERDTIPTVHN